MKRYLAIIIAILMTIGIFTSCARRIDDPIFEKNNTNDKNDKKVVDSGNTMDDKKDDDNTIYSDFDESISASIELDKKAAIPTREDREIKYALPDYDFKLDDIVNIHRFKNISPEQKEKLEKNGFVVSPQTIDEYNWINMQMYNQYETNEYGDIPSFITTDSALNLFHDYYMNTQRKIETEHLADDLSSVTKYLYEEFKDLYDKSKDENVKKALLFFAVPNALLNDEIDSALGEEVQAEIDKIDAAAGLEENLITNKEVNYKQFIPRSYYDGDEVLEKYFKAMIWYGTLGFPFVEDKKINLDNVKISLMIARTLLKSDDILEKYFNVYSITEAMIGSSDDLGIMDMALLSNELYGEFNLAKIFELKDDKKLEDAIEKLPEPKINIKQIDETMALNKQFRFMGQRFTIDSYILQTLIEPIIRPVPSSLDVLGTLGNDKAEEYAIDYKLGDMDKDDYKRKVDELSDELDDALDIDSHDSVYQAWLSVISQASDNDLDQKPKFMDNDAWEDKEIITALGNYTELKHDTVLYSKQAGAEMGGPMESENELLAYVEPNYKLYDKLAYLCEYIDSIVKAYGYEPLFDLSDDEYSRFTSFKEFYEFLRDMSIKELENIPFTEEEGQTLRYIGGVMESFYFLSQYDPDIYEAEPSSIVTDISQILDTGESLSIGTGLVDNIYVIVNYAGKKYLTVGSVYSFHEFLSDEPLTDTKWREMLGIYKEEMNGDGGYSMYYFKPELTKVGYDTMLPFVKNYRTVDNAIKFTAIDY
ncbi:MAG: DUF3160 domain-containing protein [Firmicutes bacterium]|nr:DUF3160 domain-containing protein [Bacillota bacterium]